MHATHGRRWTIAAVLMFAPGLAVPNSAAPAADKKAGLDAFETVRKVLQHPRCQNCHIPGDAPLQFDEGRTHGQNVVRGARGDGPAGLPCATCHGEKNPPDSYGPNVPPGAHGWALPPPETRMVFIGLPPARLCAVIKDPKQTNNRDLPQMLAHVSEDRLVLWGWEPGLGRAPVSVPHAEFVSAFRAWMDAGAPCPTR